MGLSRRTAVRGAWAALGLLALLAVHDLWRWQQVRQLNALISSGAPPKSVAATAPRELRFAEAAALAASDAGEAALTRYGALHGEDALGRAARYNSANLLLRQAVQLRASDQPGQALALVELAKENLREVLRQAPDDWNARYNLERAQRLVPEPDDVDEDPPDLKRNAERAATTMRGYSPGLP